MPFLPQLSLFQSEKCEFIFPEGLYIERLQSLESALRERNTVAGLPVSAYYEASRASEDAAMEASEGKIEALLPELESSSNPHLNGSGFEVLRVAFDDNSDWEEDFSPWDLCTADLSISRPHLSDEYKKLVLEKLDNQCRNDRVAQLFNVPVDTVRYCDYERMVEVEMHLMLVKRRLRSDYYASKFSVIQDFRLVRDNCMKYNGAEHELVSVANKMCEEFEAGILNEEEAAFLKESDALLLSRNEPSETRRPPSIRISLRQRTTRVTAQNGSHESRSRDRLSRQSSLENLPAPEAPSLRTTTRRGRVTTAPVPASGRRTRSMDSMVNQEEPSIQRRSLRSRGQPPNLESLSRLDSRQPRVGADRSEVNDESQRWPSRSSTRRATDNEGPSGSGFAAAESRESRRTRRSTRSAVAEHTADGEDSEGENEVEASNQNTRRSTRNSRRQSELDEFSSSEPDDQSKHEDSDPGSAAFEDDDGESDSRESEASPRPRKNSRRTAERPATRSSPRAKRPTNSAQTEEPSRKSSRKSARNRRSYEEEPSDFELDDDDMEDDDSEEEEEALNPRGRSRTRKSYAELPSDFEEEDEDFEEDDRPSRKSRQKRKRQGKHVIDVCILRLPETHF